MTASDLQPRLDDALLAVVRYPGGWWPPSSLPSFAAVVLGDDETTLVVPEDRLDGLPAPVAVERGWRRITFPGPLPWELVGFLADVASRLAAARVPFTSISGFTTDHVLVRAAQADVALAVLRGESAPELRPDVTNP